MDPLPSMHSTSAYDGTFINTQITSFSQNGVHGVEDSKRSGWMFITYFFPSVQSSLGFCCLMPWLLNWIPTQLLTPLKTWYVDHHLWSVRSTCHLFLFYHPDPASLRACPHCRNTSVSYIQPLLERSWKFSENYLGWAGLGIPICTTIMYWFWAQWCEQVLRASKDDDVETSPQ